MKRIKTVPPTRDKGRQHHSREKAGTHHSRRRGMQQHSEERREGEGEGGGVAPPHHRVWGTRDGRHRSTNIGTRFVRLPAWASTGRSGAHLYCNFVEMNKDVKLRSPGGSYRAHMLWKVSEATGRGDEDDHPGQRAEDHQSECGSAGAMDQTLAASRHGAD